MNKFNYVKKTNANALDFNKISTKYWYTMSFNNTVAKNDIDYLINEINSKYGRDLKIARSNNKDKNNRDNETIYETIGLYEINYPELYDLFIKSLGKYEHVTINIEPDPYKGVKPWSVGILLGFPTIRNKYYLKNLLYMVWILSLLSTLKMIFLSFNELSSYFRSNKCLNLLSLYNSTIFL